MTERQCGICELVAGARLLQECFRCNTPFHLNPYSNVEGIDCGDAVLASDPESFGIEYYCNPCIDAINDEIQAAEAARKRLDGVERRPGWRA